MVMSLKGDARVCVCPTCGHTWVEGQHGGHDCTVLLLAKIEELEARVVDLGKTKIAFTNPKSMEQFERMLERSDGEWGRVYAVSRGFENEVAELKERIGAAKCCLVCAAIADPLEVCENTLMILNEESI